MALAERLATLEKFEAEILTAAQRTVSAGSRFTVVDNFILGAIKRTLSQSRAFRKLVEDWNFASAAVMVRAQLDTAMRINGISYMQNPESDIAQIFNGDVTYRKLKATDGEKMTDAYLKGKLNEDHPGVAALYDELSDFVHLSFRHFWPVIAELDEEQRVARFAISAQDPKRDETNYYQVTEAFIRVTKLTGMMLVSRLMARHSPPPQQNSGAEEVEERKGGNEPTDAAT